MAYEKLPFTNYDYALGYQTINKGIANIALVRDAMDVEHFAVDAFQSGPRANGQHNSITLPRDVLAIVGIPPTSSIFMGGSGVSAIQSFSANYAGATVRLGTGAFFVPVSGLTYYYGRAEIAVTSSASIPHGICRSNFTASTAPSLGPGIYVTTYEMSSGTRVATDMNFTLTIYGAVA